MNMWYPYYNTLWLVFGVNGPEILLIQQINISNPILSLIPSLTLSLAPALVLLWSYLQLLKISNR